VSEQFLNSTSAQLGYTVPFTSVYTGKYVTRQIKNRHATKTKHNPQKANNAKYSRTKVASYNTRPGNKVGLFYKAPKPTRGHCSSLKYARNYL